MHFLTRDESKTIFLSTFGGSLELYDFIIYVFLAPVMGQLFFPAENTLSSLIGVFAVFAAGYLARPLGGLMFAHFGDKYGRKKTFTITLLLMALPTFLMGFLPTHAAVGAWASVLLTVLRLLQGLAVGGEIPGSVVFVGEHVSTAYRGLACGLVFFGINFGIVLGSAFNVLLNSFFSPEQILDWAWRLPFLFGGLLGFVSFYLRRSLTETPVFVQFIKTKDFNSIPMMQALRSYPKQLLRGVGIAVLPASIISLLFLYTTTYFSSILHYPKALVDQLNTANILLFSTLIVCVAWLSDRFGRKLFLRLGAMGLLVGIYFLYSLAAKTQIEYLIYVLIAFSVLGACVQGVFACTLIELFPTEIRYTGTAISYNLSFAIFGGLTPLTATYLIKITQDNLSPSFYLMACALICVIATIGLRDRNTESLY